MAKYIELEFVEQKIKVRARLLEEEMPRTCNELLKHLPLESIATHARYSGSEVAMLLSTDIKIGREKRLVLCKPEILLMCGSIGMTIMDWMTMYRKSAGFMIKTVHQPWQRGL